jgi:hypothetical protein
MRDYDIKQGHWKEVQGEIPRIMEEHFGEQPEEQDDGTLVIEDWKAFESLQANMLDKWTLRVDTEMKDPTDLDMDEAEETREAWNDFLLEVTGFNAKKRRDRWKEAAKENELG